MSYEFLPHEADVRVRCTGETFAELLKALADGMYAVALEEMKEKTPQTREIEVTADSPEELLVRWLQELNYLLDVHKFVAVEIEADCPNERSVKAQLRGYLCRAEDRATEIKAATYHGMTVEKTKAGYAAEVVFDL
ncbi:MAG: archease [Candidatus Hydrogenedentes bacterium]|nr:archease [Candidatus Hydrogenedentota bacterium]